MDNRGDAKTQRNETAPPRLCGLVFI